MSHRRIRQKARRQRRWRSRGQVWLPPDMVDASCLTNLLPAPPLVTSPPWSRPVRKLLTASIGLTFSIIRLLFSSTRFLGRLMAGCLVLATASSSTLLAATLKITFMLCVEQLPPTRRCRSRLEMLGLRKIKKKCDRVVKAPAGGWYEVVILAWPKLQATRCWTETPERGCQWKELSWQIGNMNPGESEWKSCPGDKSWKLAIQPAAAPTIVSGFPTSPK